MKTNILFIIIAVALLASCKKSDYCDGCNEQLPVETGYGLQYVQAVYIFDRIEVDAMEPSDGFSDYNPNNGNLVGPHKRIVAHTQPSPSSPTVEVWVPDAMIGNINFDFDLATEPNEVISLYYAGDQMWTNNGFGWVQYQVTVITNASDVWLY